MAAEVALSAAIGTAWYSVAIYIIVTRTKYYWIGALGIAAAPLSVAVNAAATNKPVSIVNCVILYVLLLACSFPLIVVYDRQSTRAVILTRLLPELLATILCIVLLRSAALGSRTIWIVTAASLAVALAYIAWSVRDDAKFRALERQSRRAVEELEAAREKERAQQEEAQRRIEESYAEIERRAQRIQKQLKDEAERKRRQEEQRLQEEQRQAAKRSAERARVRAEKLAREAKEEERKRMKAEKVRRLHKQRAADEARERATRKAEQKAAASIRYRGMEPREIYEHDRELLRILISMVGADVTHSIRIDEVEELAVPDVWVRSTRPQQRGFLTIESEDQQYWNERLRLTLEGQRYFDQTIDGSTYVMGDQMFTGDNAVVVNRSTLENSLNAVRAARGDDAAIALRQVADVVAGSNSPDAAMQLDAFNVELAQPEPRKPILRSLFNGVVEAAPAVSSMTDAITKVSELFN